MAESHCDSYYAASTDTATFYPPLAGDQSCDVCVIGAGFTGLSTALTLAERGYSVILLEQHQVGWGASGRNGGQIIGGFTGDNLVLEQMGAGHEDELFQLGYRGHQVIEQWVERYNIDCDLKYGYMDAAFKPRHMTMFRGWHEELDKRGLGDKIRMVEKDEISSVLGTDSYIGGLINNRNGHLHPLKLCQGEARAAASLGVKIYEQTEVLDIEHGDKPRVKTAQGNVRTNKVVLASNAYNQLEKKKLAGLLFPAGTFIIATEPLSEEEAAQINPLDMAVCDANEVLDYYRLSADRRLLFGGRCNYSGRVPSSIKRTMQPRMLNIFPQLESKRIDYEWGGTIGIVVNRVPLMGRVSDNVFYAMGYSGHGVNMTHLAGEIMADAVAGTFEKLDVFEKVGHKKIPFGQSFGSQMVALGMLYYRLKDLL
ncbi:MAG: glycine/D-amino acid oxidase-like deaminating enzyme [Oceanicoccus sp.]|jgi:glycine/D-amino acid oxidase-like deaminating enzyme